MLDGKQGLEADMYIQAHEPTVKIPAVIDNSNLSGISQKTDSLGILVESAKKAFEDYQMAISLTE